MGDIRTEPSMEEILASIKRIIADDGPALDDGPGRAQPDFGDAPLAAPPEPADATPLSAAPPAAPSIAPPPAAPPAPPAANASGGTTPPSASSLVSEDAACASRQSLSALSSMVLRTAGTDNTLDGLVRELLRPLLKDWLDARLPDLVESLVAREIARITGKAL